MKLSFRQGIVKAQTNLSGPAFLQRTSLSGDSVDLLSRNVNTVPVTLAFAHYDANYLFEETYSVPMAWGSGGENNGPLVGTNSKWLYWDIALDTGLRTFGWTALNPVISPVEPPAPQHNQHWFNTTLNVMKVCVIRAGVAHWQDKIRLFAARYEAGGTFAQPYPHGGSVWVGGSQVALPSGNFPTGAILYGANGKPLRQSNAGSSTFATTETLLTVGGTAGQNVKFEATTIFARAAEEIPKFHLVCFDTEDDDGTIRLAKSTDRQNFVSGIVIDDLHENDTGQIIMNGVVVNEQWAFTPSQINKPLFCDATGALTFTRQLFGSNQQVAYVTGYDSICINIFPPVKLTVNLPTP